MWEWRRRLALAQVPCGESCHLILEGCPCVSRERRNPGTSFFPLTLSTKKQPPLNYSLVFSLGFFLVVVGGFMFVCLFVLVV